MKKYMAFMLTIILLLCSTGCSSIALQNNNHEFILTPKACKGLFSCNPNEVRDALEESPWVEGHFVSATENEDGNLLLILSDSDIQFWKTAIEKKLEKYKKNASDSGCALDFNGEYTSITFKVTQELAFAAGFDMVSSLPFCGIMQMFNGDDPNAWYVDVIVIDVETGKIVKQSRLPDGRLNITEEDWDRVLGEAVE